MEYFRNQIKLGITNTDDPEQAEIVLSNKGGPKLIDNGFMYTMHKKQTSNIRWRCVLRSSQCRGSLITSTDFKLPRVRMGHNHGPDYAAARLARTRYIALGKPPLLQEAIPHPTFEDMPSLFDKIKEEPKDDYDEVTIPPQTLLHMQQSASLQNGGRRANRVMQSGSQGTSGGRTIRIATQSLVRQPLRNIAPAPTSGQHRQQQPQHQHQQQQQQHHQPKTLVLKTIPLKVKQVAPTTIKMTPRPPNVGIPHNILPQQATEVCLRWNSYHSNMQNSFPSLLDAEQFVDVTLACEGRSLKCHKMILSSCSDYLAALLRENPCQHPIILMRDLKFWEVEALVKFMYRGEVNVAHDKLPQLLNAAEALQIKGLAGPSPSLQNPKLPKLVPQSKPLIGNQSLSSPLSTGSPRIPSETKESRNKGSSLLSPCNVTTSSSATTSSSVATASANMTSSTTTTTTSNNNNINNNNGNGTTTSASPLSSVIAVASPKRSQKRQASEPPQPRIFTKIRLQRPVTPTSPNLTVKSEPLDIPLSPTEIFSDQNRRSRNRRHRRPSRDEDASSGASNFDNLVMALHDEDEDPGGGGGGDDAVGGSVGASGVGGAHGNHEDEDEDDDRCSDDGDMNFRDITGVANQNDPNENEEQMEFVPTDFLDQEQDIVEEAEYGKSSDDDEDVEEDDDEDENEEEDEAEEEEEEEDDEDEDDVEEDDDDQGRLVEESLRRSHEERKKNHSDEHRATNDKRNEHSANPDKTLV